MQIEARGLSRQFRRRDGTVVHALDDVSLAVGRGELVVLLGPSGCGKTTLLRSIAGLETPTAGEIRLGSELVFSSTAGVFVPPEKRDGLGFMFQSYALWPHMTAFDNVAYPLFTIGMRREEATQRVASMLSALGIGDLARQYPNQMSGGQQQRVALARALISSDRAILFDEPLSNVDAQVRHHVRIEIAALQRRINFSGVYVTHDQSEAMAIADRVAVMRQGKIAQIGTPQEIFVRPATRFVARFTGQLNELPADALGEANGNTILRTPAGDAHAPCVADEGQHWLAFRPHSCQLSATPVEGPGFSWKASVVAVLYQGATSEYVLDVGGTRITVAGVFPFATEGAHLYVSAPRASLLVYPRGGAEDQH